MGRILSLSHVLNETYLFFLVNIPNIMLFVKYISNFIFLAYLVHMRWLTSNDREVLILFNGVIQKVT